MHRSRQSEGRASRSWLVCLGVLLLALVPGGCCPVFCPKPKPPARENEPPKREGRLSPPIVKAPLWGCSSAVVVQGFIPGARIDVYIDGSVHIGGGVTDATWGQSFAVAPDLVDGKQVTATQTFNGMTSAHSAPVIVGSYFSEHPEGLPKPVVRDPAYNCGGAISVTNLVPGGKLETRADGNPVGGVDGCGAGQWHFVAPDFGTAQKVTSTETLCSQAGPTSDPVQVLPEPTSLSALTLSDLYEGGKYINAYGIANGAMVTVMSGATPVAGHACSGGGQIFRLDPAPAAGATLTASQKLCSTASNPSPGVTVQPCSALPAPQLAPACLGETTVRIIGGVPDARIRVHSGTTLLADGGGPLLALLRPIQAGDVLTATQALDSCVSPRSPAFSVGERACSIPSYQPTFWNDGGTVQRKNNCYNYSNNKRTDTFAQPGKAAGITLSWGDMRCDRVHAAAVADGLLPATANEKCPCSKDKLALVVDPETDYHWYRTDSDGRWSHKPGRTQATNQDNGGDLIGNPETAKRGGYTEFCGYFCSCSDRIQGAGHEVIQ